MKADEFITRWAPSGGNERANTQLFVNDLCALLGVRSPEPTRSDTAENDYVFERHVVKTEIDGTTSNGWIDCYKRDCFILEAKQGSAADIRAVEEGAGESLRDFFGQTAAERFKRGMAKRGTGQWTAAMQKAAGQAEGYAKALPKEHGWPPFLLVSDIGYCIDVYADFSRSGKGYVSFPDRRRSRIDLDDLRDEKVRERLIAIWNNPMSLDPSAEAARVTREIADHLATVARRLEAREQNPDRVAHFLMRLLFTMFAEDTGLIPKESFSALLKKVRDRPENVIPALSDLWKAMDAGGYVGSLGEAGGETVRQFNGYLFKETVALPLEGEEIDVLIAAAASDWRQVEPAIFGTLLERALNPKERAKLGAYYTPRAYVERLVEPTIMEPLKEDWLGARTAAADAAQKGDKDAARKIVETFHGKLARTTVLDPACGTGNFLYVAMARMKELEGEVLELLQELGDDQYLAEISGHTITPENFLGIEINPRAAAIAQLVLWIGYLQWHFKVNGEERMPEPPVLRDVKTIECRDALIEYDGKELERDQYGRPVTRWDGDTMKLHPLTGKLVPDETARAEVYKYVNPRAAKWPTADFIVGNPPFIGKRQIRLQLGDDYVEALRAAIPPVPDGADLVAYWWQISGTLAEHAMIRAFGLVATNSITQTFSRRVLEALLAATRPVSIVFAIRDAPWLDPDGAAVRVNMAVVRPGRMPGQLVSMRTDRTDPVIDESVIHGTINADMTIGATAVSVAPLEANRGLCSVGYQLNGLGFIVEPKDFATWAGRPGQTPQIIFPLRNGSDLNRRPRNAFVIDFFGYSERAAREIFPDAYQWVLARVKPERDQSREPSRRTNWLQYGRTNEGFRRAASGIPRMIVGSVTSKHRFFSFEPSETHVDSTAFAIMLYDAFYLGAVTSRFHVEWSLRAGSTLEDRPRYNKSTCFDPFPFPETSDEALKERIRDAAEKLDALRKRVLELQGDLTLTKLYNTLEVLRSAEASRGVLSNKERDIAERGCVPLIRQYHDEIDEAVAEAYGWSDLLINPTDGPSPGARRTVWVDGADELILERLIALNNERAAGEARGHVRWLRPEFQAPGYVAPAEQNALALSEEPKAAAAILEWPSKLPEQVVAVAAVVERAGRPVAANQVASSFKGKRGGTVAPVLDALAGMGRLRKLEDGRYAA